MSRALNVISLLALSWCLCTIQLATSQQAKTGNEETLNKFRDRYNVDSVIRDTEHIKEDLKHLIDLQKDGAISDEQSIFYVMRMHDFDDNNLLDGLELMKLVSHSHGIRPDAHDATEEQLAAAADAFLFLDSNQDGFISYAEWVESNRRSKAKK